MEQKDKKLTWYHPIDNRYFDISVTDGGMIIVERYVYNPEESKIDRIDSTTVCDLLAI